MSNAYAQLPDFSADPSDNISTTSQPDDDVTNVTKSVTNVTQKSKSVTNVTQKPKCVTDVTQNSPNVTNITQKSKLQKPKLGNQIPSSIKQKAIKRCLARQIRRNENAHENALIDEYIEWTEDERTALATWDTEASKFSAIEQAHEGYPTKCATVLQLSKNFGYNLRARAKRAVQKLVDKQPHVRFAPKAQICTFHLANQAIMLT